MSKNKIRILSLTALAALLLVSVALAGCTTGSHASQPSAAASSGQANRSGTFGRRPQGFGRSGGVFQPSQESITACSNVPINGSCILSFNGTQINGTCRDSPNGTEFCIGGQRGFRGNSTGGFYRNRTFSNSSGYSGNLPSQ